MKKSGYMITQTRVVTATDRLLSANRLFRPKEKSPTNTAWISYVPEFENESIDSKQKAEGEQIKELNKGGNL